MSRAIRGIIFDMDGLMVDTESLLTRFWIDAAAYYGWEMRREHVLGIRSLAGKYAAPKLQREVAADFDYQLVRAKRIELMNSYIEKNGIEKKKGLDELLEWLGERDYLLAVATATDLERTTRYLGSVGVLDRFNKLICGDMVKTSKPDPDIYLTAARELGLEPEECAALEDSPNGIISAYRAGCLPIMIPDLSQPDETLTPMLYACCNDLSGVIEVLER